MSHSQGKTYKEGVLTASSGLPENQSAVPLSKQRRASHSPSYPRSGYPWFLWSLALEVTGPQEDHQGGGSGSFAFSTFYLTTNEPRPSQLPVCPSKFNATIPGPYIYQLGKQTPATVILHRFSVFSTLGFVPYLILTWVLIAYTPDAQLHWSGLGY